MAESIAAQAIWRDWFGGTALSPHSSEGVGGSPVALPKGAGRRLLRCRRIWRDWDSIGVWGKSRPAKLVRIRSNLPPRECAYASDSEASRPHRAHVARARMALGAGALPLVTRGRK